MSNPTSSWPARADAALVAVLAFWAGALAASGLTAAVAFPAMKKLGPSLPGIPPAVPDHWIIAAGSIAQPVFEISGIAQAGCAALAVVLAIGRFGRMRRSSPRAGATLLAAVIVAAGATGASALVLVPGMSGRWAAAMEAARAGDIGRTASIRRSFDRDHRLVSAVMQGSLFFTLTGLVIAIGTAPGPTQRGAP